MIVNGLFEFGPYRLDAAKRLLTRDGNSVTLAPKTYELLLLMVQSDGRALSKQELLRALWADTFVEEASLAFQVNALRKALGDDGNEWIETVPRHGYRFTASVSKTLTYGERAAELVSPSVSATPARATRLLALIAVLSTTAAVLFGALYFRRSPAVERQVRFLPSPPENVHFAAAPPRAPGRQKPVFGGVDPDRRSRLDLLSFGHRCAAFRDRGRAHPFWSPDSRSIGFFTNGKLKRVNLGSGPPQTIYNLSRARGRNMES
jgi:DNA-binding winged helix-turn-helix (wHTH) protein